MQPASCLPAIHPRPKGWGFQLIWVILESPTPTETKPIAQMVEEKPKKSKQERLAELKEMFYLKHLSKEAYTEMKNAISNSAAP